MAKAKASAKDYTITADTPVEEAIEKLAAHGSLLCKAALDTKPLSYLRDNAERFFGYAEYCAVNKLEINEVNTYNCTTGRMAANLLCLNPRLKPISLQILSLMKNSYVHKILQSRFDNEQAQFLFQSSRVRKVYPPTHLLNNAIKSCFPYHQDGIPVGNSTASIAAWIPMTDCGKTAPGLEVAMAPQSDLIPLKNDPESIFRDFEIPEDAIEAAIGTAERWRPEFEFGDLQLIPATTLYASTSEEGMDRASIGVELRFASPDDAASFPREQQPILV